MKSNSRLLRIAAGLAGVMLFVVLQGCAPTIKVESNLDPGYRADLDRIFVVVDTRRIDDATMRISSKGGEFGGGAADTNFFMKEFLAALVVDFESAGVTVMGHAITGLELSPSDITNQAAAFGADAVLNIKESWFLVMKDSAMLGLIETRDVAAIDLDAFILDKNNPEKAVWRALLKVETGRNGWIDMARTLSRSLVDQLIQDGLVRPGVAPIPAADVLKNGA